MGVVDGSGVGPSGLEGPLRASARPKEFLRRRLPALAAAPNQAGSIGSFFFVACFGQEAAVEPPAPGMAGMW